MYAKFIRSCGQNLGDFRYRDYDYKLLGWLNDILIVITKESQWVMEVLVRGVGYDDAQKKSAGLDTVKKIIDHESK